MCVVAMACRNIVPYFSGYEPDQEEMPDRLDGLDRLDKLDRLVDSPRSDGCCRGHQKLLLGLLGLGLGVRLRLGMRMGLGLRLLLQRGLIQRWLVYL